MNHIKPYKFIFTVMAICIIASPLYANNYGMSEANYSSMESKVNSMNMNELRDNAESLKVEQNDLTNVINSDSATEVEKQNALSRLQEIAAELSMIQKVLVAIAGLGVVSAITDDGYNDNVPPVITIIGDNPATVELGSTYIDAGASALDAYHGTTTVSSSSNVDTTAVGSYLVTYLATDRDANTAVATRTVNVVDTTNPVVTVTGDNPATVELGTSYTDAGASATDLSGAVEVTSTGEVDTTVVGNYTITYSSTDASGNTGTATRTVNVVDTTAPVFTSSSTFIIDENQTAVGTVTATDLATLVFTIDSDVLQITAAGVLSFVAAPDFESQSSFNYDGSTMDFTATVTATDASDNASTQDITVKVRDVGGIDDNTNTGTGTGTGTNTVGTATGTMAVGTGTATNANTFATATGTQATATGTIATGTGTATTATSTYVVETASGTGTGTTTGVGTGTGTVATDTGTEGTGGGTESTGGDVGTGTGTVNTGGGTTGTGSGTGTG